MEHSKYENSMIRYLQQRGETVSLSFRLNNLNRPECWVALLITSIHLLKVNFYKLKFLMKFNNPKTVHAPIKSIFAFGSEEVNVIFEL